MRSDIVTIEPQIIQFGRDNTQTIKIINNTSNPIANFFFCLYNLEKFAFSPDSFSLAPNEHKLITITLKVKSVRSVAKEFAYLKSTQINKRITLLINNFQSPETRNRNNDEGMEDINTLSSREYRDVQTNAIQKIIKEKEAYIAMLQKEREGVNRSINFRTEESAEKVNIFKRESEELEMKLIMAENQKQSILKENIILQEKFEQYRKYCQEDLKNYQKINYELNDKNSDIIKMQEQIHYLEEQGHQFLQKIQEKEDKIRQLQEFNRKIIEDQRKQAEKKFNYMEEKLEQQKKAYLQSSRYSEERIKQLEKKLQISESLKQKAFSLQKQIRKKDDDLKHLMGIVQTERSNIKQFEQEKKKLIKYQLLTESINQKNNQLTSRLKQFQKLNHNLKEQIFVYKSKLAENDVNSDKMSQYLQIALDGVKSENNSLKRQKKQLQKSLQEFMLINRQSHDNNKVLSEQLSKYKEQINLLMEIKDNLERRNQQLKQEHHLTLMKMKSENIELLQKLSIGESSRKEQKINKLEDQLVSKSRDLERVNIDYEESLKKIESLEKQNSKLNDKVKKYKKQARKQLRSINDTAINQLHKQHSDKKKMAKRILQLEQVILNYSCDKVREQSRQNKRQTETRIQLNVNTESNLKKERASSRIIGIKDQRKQINQTNKAYSVTSNQEQVYVQLGELRELNNYIKNQEERFAKIFDFDDELDIDESELKEETRPIFRVIKFFKKMQNKMRQVKGESQIVNIKEIQYLKGRIKQLESVKQEKDNMSSINLSKTRQQCGELLDFVREQMKSQYKKLNQINKLWENKYQLLKKKIYEQYRAKIVQVLNKKDKTSIPQLETTLQRFIDGMSNLSHKEAVLQKQVKLKQNAKKQNLQLKQKVNELNYVIQTKKGYCSRDRVKVLYNQTQIQWQQSLKRQAQFLTLTAEYQRIKEEFEFMSDQLSQAKQDMKRFERQLDQKSNQLLKMKKYQVQMQSQYQSQIQKQYEIVEENKKKIMEMTKSTKESIKSSNRQKQYNSLKQNLDRKNQIIKELRNKEKMLEDILEETHRSQEKQKRKLTEESRVMESMRDLKQNNRDLRTQNGKMKQKINKLEQQLQKKNIYVKNLKGDLQENRIRVQKKQEVECEKLKDQIKKLGEQLKRTREDLQKTKKRKEKQLSQMRNEIDRLKNQNLITEKSMESIIRALMDTIKKVYSRIRRLIKKKKGKEVEDQQKLFETSQGVHINALKIDQIFDQVLTIFEQID